MMDTIHGCALVVEGQGILILGDSGSGKSELALDLLDQCKLRGLIGVLIGDDRIILTRKGDGVYASVPAPLAGLIEVRGSGIHKIDYVSEARLHFVVRLVTPQQSVRMPDDQEQEVAAGIFLPCLTLPQGNFSALRVILARLGHYGGVLPHI
jgi:serine kinase of HPr protein (carbohydrate metabolism regulator)